LIGGRARCDGVVVRGRLWQTVDMSTGVLSVRLPDELKARLDALSASTGRTAAFYVREAIAQHLADLECAYTLQAEAEAVRRGEIKTRSLTEISAELGLD
jgi:RHH-type transcriptional regulator, rel operon repressor / antitoxin RelB